MKKLATMFLAVVMVLSLSACGGQTASNNTEQGDYGTENTEDTPASNGESDEEAPIENDSTFADGIRPEFKEAMDAYEVFYEEYCDFMEKYSENPTDTELLAEYVNMLSKAEEMNAAFESWDEDDLTSEELKYYLDVNNRVMQMLADVSG